MPEGGAISYLEWPNDRPILHFAHANGFNAETYRALLSPLSDRFHIFASDARGHGFSTLPSAPGLARWSNYRDDLHALSERLSPGPLVLAGHSMGAIASLMIAAAWPERVRALVLVEPVLVPASAFLLMHLARFSGRFSPGPNLAERAAKRREIFPSFEEARAAYRGRGAFKTWPPETLDDYLRGGLLPSGNGTEMRLACSPSWEAESFRQTPHGKAWLARKISCPLTVLYGDDGTAREGDIRVIARLKPGARLIKVRGATHFLPMEHPETVRAEILRFA